MKLQDIDLVKAELLKELIPILGDMRLALQQHAHQDTATVKQGVALILRKLETIMRSHGAEPIPTIGERFDSTLHEAISTGPATHEHPANTIISEIRPGYCFGGKVLEVARVIVARTAEHDELNISEGYFEIKEITPFSLEVEIYGGATITLIDRGTPIPVKASQVFSTREDKQSHIELHVLQRGGDIVRENHSLGRFCFDGILPAPAGAPQIEVTLSIDADGLVSGRVKDLGTGKEITIPIVSPK